MLSKIFRHSTSGLPSLTAAERHNVVATDVDELALELVQAAADEQGLTDMVLTRLPGR